MMQYIQSRFVVKTGGSTVQWLRSAVMCEAMTIAARDLVSRAAYLSMAAVDYVDNAQLKPASP